MAPQQDIFANLRAWLHDAGAYMHHVRVAVDPDNPDSRRLEASAAMEADTPFLRIPASHLITEVSARAVPHVAAVMEAVAATDLPSRLPDVTTDSAALILFVASELARGSASALHTWMATQPAHVPTPITQPAAVVDALLAGTPVHTLVHTLRAELDELYTDWFVPHAVEQLPDHFPRTACTPLLFARAHAIVESRAFQLESHTVLAPLADMANHAPRDTARCNARARAWKTDDRPDELGVELVTRSGVDAGNELCIYYGTMPNWQLLVHYGFAVRRNEDDAIAVSLEPPCGDGDDLSSEIRRVLLLRGALDVDIDTEGLDFTLTHDEPLPSRMLATARLLLLHGAELANVTVRNDFYKPLSLRNERAVLDRVDGMVDALLGEMDAPENNEVDDGTAHIPAGADPTFAKSCRAYVRDSLDILHAAQSRLARLREDAEAAAVEGRLGESIQPVLVAADDKPAVTQ